jgi:hypothetical protein
MPFVLDEQLPCDSEKSLLAIPNDLKMVPEILPERWSLFVPKTLTNDQVSPPLRIIQPFLTAVAHRASITTPALFR